MTDNPKQLRLHCKACDLTFDTGFTFPMRFELLKKCIEKVKCPTCGTGAEELFIRGAKK